MTSQLCTYDFTCSVELCPDRAFLQTTLNGWCKKWVFQKEKGESGYEHWQGRVSLIHKKRIKEIVAQIKIPGIHWSPTSKAVHEGQNFNYVMKIDTRIEGPWSDQDFTEPPPLTRQLKAFMKHKRWPWQDKVLEWCNEEEDRYIRLINDTIGNAGKSILAEYIEYIEAGYEVPPFRLMEDIMACAMSIGAQKCYLIDMPRAMKKDKLSEFYAGLEALKNGVAYDKRYKFKKRRFDRPQIIVFTNRDPCWDYMSLDRWQVWDMQADKSLKLRNLTPVIDYLADQPGDPE